MVVLAGVVPIGMLMTVADSGRSSAWVLTWVLMVWSGYRLSLLVSRARPLLFTFIWWIFVYVFMGLAASIQLRTGFMPTTTPAMDPALDMATAVAVWLGVGAWEVGALVAARRHGLDGHPDSVRPPDDGSASAALASQHRRSRFVALVGIGAALYFIWSIGFGTLLTSREEVDVAKQATWPDLSTASIVFAMGTYVCMVGAHAVYRTRAGVLTFGDRVLVILAAVLAVLAANPLGSARYVAGTVLLSLAALLGAFATRRRTQLSLVGGTCGFLFVFPVADAFRYSTLSISRTGFYAEYAGNGDYDAFAQISNALLYVQDASVTWGNQFLGVMLFWVPRSLWVDKPIDTGSLLADFRRYSFGNLSAPLWAEAIVNFGLVGVVCTFLALGYGATRMDARGSMALLSARGYWAIVAGTVPFYGVIILRGSLLQATGGLAALLLALFIARRGAVRPAGQFRLR